MKNIVVYPTSANPPTWGHGDILERAAKQFDKIYWVVGKNRSKNPLFSIDERKEMMKKYVEHYNLKNVIIDEISGATVRYAEKVKANLLLRGLRNTSDFQMELDLSIGNRGINKDIETICLFAKPHFATISSSLIRELALLDENIDQYVLPDIIPIIKKALEKQSF